MQMTDWEICQMFLEAADQKSQIMILADMNLCEPREVVALLRKNGIDTSKKALRRMKGKKSHYAVKRTLAENA